MRRLLILAFCFSTLFISQSQAAIVIRGTSIYDANDMPSLPVEEHFALAAEAYNNEDYPEAMQQFRIVTNWFPLSPQAKDSHFYLAVCYYHLGEYEFANLSFSEYLKCQNNPQYFEETLLYKFDIAERFRGGAKRRPFGWRKMPLILTGHKIALEIYNEIIVTTPCHEVAAYALFSKGTMLWRDREYCDSIEAFLILIKRFPKHELAPLAYCAISQIYVERCTMEFQNPDLLALAELNSRKFHMDFPGEELLSYVDQDVISIKELYAGGLYDTGLFYERICKPSASVIYYRKAINQFPETEVARCCQERLDALMASPELLDDCECDINEGLVPSTDPCIDPTEVHFYYLDPAL